MNEGEPNITEQLRSIRKEANVGVREMARRLGMPSPSSYAHYEDPKRFKARYLPMEIAIKIAEALEESGIPKQRVIALSGVHQDEENLQSVDARLGQLTKKRREILLNLLEDLEAADAIDRERAKIARDERG